MDSGAHGCAVTEGPGPTPPAKPTPHRILTNACEPVINLSVSADSLFAEIEFEIEIESDGADAAP
jgi:hypothetical protein